MGGRDIVITEWGVDKDRSIGITRLPSWIVIDVVLLMMADDERDKFQIN
jgi:hypothetical protein